jgi:hypothetical protein
MHLYTYDNAIKGLTYPRPNAHTPHGQGGNTKVRFVSYSFLFSEGCGSCLTHSVC